MNLRTCLPMTFSSIRDVNRYLADIPKFQTDHAKAADFNLDKFRDFCDAVGAPQEDFPSVHVAGTNGKGSTCRILASVYSEVGYTTGLYTSPHILAFNERFEINGQRIADEALVHFFREFSGRMEAYKLTYFEISTAIAFWWFSKSQIDLGIIEVGLGGRLDATNIIHPAACIITSIALDHTDILGDTLAEVAREKAGIIKQGCPVVLGRLPEEAEAEVCKYAAQTGAGVIDIDSLKPAFEPPHTVILNIDGRRKELESSLTAPIQAQNVALAWQVSRILNAQFPLSFEQFRRGVKNAEPGYGRFEPIGQSGKWYFDGAHNVEAVQKMKESLSLIGKIEEATLVLSLMKDKINPEMMNELSEFKNIYYYTLNTERAASFDDIIEWLPQMTLFPIRKSRQKQWLKEFDSELVIFAGSFYFYATVRDWMETFV